MKSEYSKKINKINLQNWEIYPKIHKRCRVKISNINRYRNEGECDMASYCCNTGTYSRLRMFALLFSVLVLAASTGNVMALTLDKAKWNAGKQKLIVIGTGNRGETVSVVNANDAAKVLGSKTLTKKRWRTTSRRPAPVPCAVRVLSSNGESAGPLDVEDRPANCGPVSSPPANEAPDCVIDTPSTDITISEGATVNYAGTVTDADGNLDAVSWVFDGGTPADSALQDPGNVSYATAGIYTTTLDAIR